PLAEQEPAADGEQGEHAAAQQEQSRRRTATRRTLGRRDVARADRGATPFRRRTRRRRRGRLPRRRARLGARRGRRFGRRQPGRAGSGQTAAGLVLVELVEVLARQGVRGLDLEDPAEGRARGGEITGVELGDPFVEDLFDLALLLGLELSRALDLARRLVVVD